MVAESKHIRDEDHGLVIIIVCVLVKLNHFCSPVLRLLMFPNLL